MRSTGPHQQSERDLRQPHHRDRDDGPAAHHSTTINYPRRKASVTKGPAAGRVAVESETGVLQK